MISHKNLRCRQVPQSGRHSGAGGSVEGQGQQREDSGRHLARSHRGRQARGEGGAPPLSVGQRSPGPGERLSRARSPQSRDSCQETRPTLVSGNSGGYSRMCAYVTSGHVCIRHKRARVCDVFALCLDVI